MTWDPVVRLRAAELLFRLRYFYRLDGYIALCVPRNDCIRVMLTLCEVSLKIHCGS